MLRMQLSRIMSVVCSGVLLAGAASARNPGDPLKPGFNLFSKQQDVQLGQEAAQQVRQQYQVVQNPALQNYLKQVGERLANTNSAKQGGFPFNFTLLNVGEINAFALPGGPMFVFTGLMKATDNEAQLAGVMAHEMSHVILRHGTNQASKANLIQLPAVLAGSVAGNGSMLGQLAQLGVGLGANSVLLKFSRDAETQADALGSHMMSEAGYNPVEMARFFEKLQGASGSGPGSQFFSDHPNPGNREKAIEAEIQVLPQRSYGYETGEFARVKQQIQALPAPPKQAQPRSSNAAPSSSGSALAPSVETPAANGWKQLRERSFGVAYPSNWQVFGGSQSGSTTIAPREGLVQASNGSTQVGYGAILSYYTPQRATNLSGATQELLGHMQSSNPTMRVARSPQHLSAGGSAGLFTLLESDSPYGGKEVDALLTVARPEGLFYLVFISPSKDFPQLQSALQQMIGSLRFFA